MEAVTNTAKTVFSGHGSEPISGASGDVSRGEPYDAGNMEQNDQERLKRSMDDDENQRPDANKAAADDDDGALAEPTGDAPRPLSDLAKDHGGSAGSTESTSASSGGQGRQGGDRSGSGSGGPQAEGESHGEGTGEMWVKTTGFAADGGDFDASKPGAGREADRLMEAKDPSRAAAHHSGTGETAASQPSEPTKTPSGGSGKSGNSDSSGARKEKESLMDKIKHKLHKD